MNIWDIVKKVGVGVFENVVPGGSAIIDVVNEFLPDDNKLSKNATGEDVEKAINSLSPEQRAQLMLKEFDVKIKAYDSLQTMLKADNNQSTRAFIAKWSFIFTASFSGLVGILYMIILTMATRSGDVSLVTSIVNGWPLAVAVIGTVTTPFVILLRAYFGLLSKEHENKLGSATGNFKPGMIASALNILRGKNQ